MGGVRVVNRQAVVVAAKQPFVDWINRVEKQSGNEATFDLARVNCECNTYLVQEFDMLDDTREYFETFKPAIFEAELNGWFTDPVLWPRDRSNEVFDRWLEVDVYSVVVDLERGRLKKRDRFE